MNNRILEPADLMSLETYSRERATFRPRVIEHKKRRSVQCGPNATWCFEDRLTVQYQVQEMLRIERIFEAEGIADELGTYNPLIPDGTNWKVTLLIEFPDEAERREALAGLKGIEDRCWVQVTDHARVLAIADEDLERENDEKDVVRALPEIRARRAHGGCREGRRSHRDRHRPRSLPVLGRARAAPCAIRSPPTSPDARA
jgi:hypothetical protein